VRKRKNMVVFMIVGGVFVLSGIACFFWPENLWASEVRRHAPADEDNVEPSKRALVDMQVRGVICLLVGLAILSSPLWSR
jgi:uncharacterized membrane protein HdeD (DUF308 family)